MILDDETGKSVPVTVLVDTGCAVPLILRRGLFDSSVLKPSKRPVRFVTASGETLAGGEHGLHLKVQLPVRDFRDNPYNITCSSVWAFEAALPSLDAIVGFPFLALFQLLVDPALHCLRIIPTDPAAVDNFSDVPACISESSSLLDALPLSRELTPASGPEQARQSVPTPLSVDDAVYLAETVVTQPSMALPLVESLPSEPSPVLVASSCPVEPLFPVTPVTSAAWPISPVDDMADVRAIVNACLPSSPCTSPTLHDACFAFWDLSHDLIPVMNPSCPCSELADGCEFSTKTAAVSSSSTVPTGFRSYPVCASGFDADSSWLMPDRAVCGADWLPTSSPVSPISKHSKHQHISSVPWRPTPRQLGSGFKTEHYTVCQSWFSRILEWAEFVPAVDAFATANNARLPQFWTVADDAFAQDWSSVPLWMNPPFSRLTSVLDKIIRDESYGILVVPVWTRFDWFTLLGRIAINWWDIPPDEPFFQDENGQPLPPRPNWTVRVVVFDAFGARERLTLEHAWFDNADVRAVHGTPVVPTLSPCQDLQAAVLSESGRPHTVGTIESALEHPEAKDLLERPRRDYHDVFYGQHLARDVDPVERGPWGVARINLIDGAVPRKMRPFRMAPDRENALEELLRKCEAKGWIEPSSSDWSAQAFVVPKPDDPSTTSKQWRLVIDYRYLNSQTCDDPFPLPLIDNLIVKQLENRLWSIFDLQDGFHQMHLEPECQRYTAFQTPWGSYQFTVLPMGVNNGPSMFQRMISWVLRDVPRAVVYVDDVLSGTPVGEPGCLLRDHDRDVRNILDAFRLHKLCVKGSKVHLFQQQIKFCGHVLSSGTILAAPSKLRAISAWTHTMVTTVKRLKSFLGLAQYYSPYVKNFAALAFPLTEKLKTPYSRRVDWTDEMIVAFETIKKELLTNVVLHIPDPNKPYVLECDACDYAVGGVLSQEDGEGRLRLVAFFSRKLQGSPGRGQWAWSIREKETYAIVLCLLKFQSSTTTKSSSASTVPSGATELTAATGKPRGSTSTNDSMSDRQGSSPYSPSKRASMATGKLSKRCSSASAACAYLSAE